MRFDVLELHCTDETQKVETARMSCLQLLHRLSPDPAVTSTHYQKERIVHQLSAMYVTFTCELHSYCELLSLALALALALGLVAGETRCAGCLCNCSGWFKHIEPRQTFPNHIITEIAKCVEFSVRYSRTTPNSRQRLPHTLLSLH